MPTPDEEYYYIEFKKEDRRKVNPLKLKNILNEKNKNQLEELKTDSRNGFSLKVKKAVLKNLLLNDNNFEQSHCKISFQKFLIQTKVVI